jgi:hypothetical protein
MLGAGGFQTDIKKRLFAEPFLDLSLFFFVLSTFFVQVPIDRLLLTFELVKPVIREK